jgi:hypothetical protein
MMLIGQIFTIEVKAVAVEDGIVRKFSRYNRYIFGYKFLFTGSNVSQRKMEWFYLVYRI